MKRVRVKICGITSLTDLKIAVEAGADAVGMVVEVPQSPRNITMSKAKELIETTPIFVETVVVTVPENVTYVYRIQEELNPSGIQVHGLNHMIEEVRDKITRSLLIGTVQAKSDLVIDNVVKVARYCDAILLDSFVPGKKGGSGVIHDWEISKRVREAIHPKPLILAGGLTPQNIKQAISTVKPFAVDVSSGVEASPGKKDPMKVIEFIKNIKEVEI